MIVEKSDTGNHAITDEDIIFIRHGESTFNVASHDFRQERKLGFDWAKINQDS